jgi:hypothetical protein
VSRYTVGDWAAATEPASSSGASVKTSRRRIAQP